MLCFPLAFCFVYVRLPECVHRFSACCSPPPLRYGYTNNRNKTIARLFRQKERAVFAVLFRDLITVYTANGRPRMRFMGNNDCSPLQQICSGIDDGSSIIASAFLFVAFSSQTTLVSLPLSPTYRQHLPLSFYLSTAPIKSPSPMTNSPVHFGVDIIRRFLLAFWQKVAGPF